ncbi:hypothetical protein IQ255_10490 [Pleurocapsales cyanobacterium LEGE 10410]|nr:hypothetical protein [Pleurocapsales cyanobacterium LEGE 10410]
MKNLFNFKTTNKKVLFGVLGIMAIASFSNTNNTEYGNPVTQTPAYSSYPSSQTFPTYPTAGTTAYPTQNYGLSYEAYQERINDMDGRHQQNLDLIWGN